ncbi:hypothetical protein GGR57DRAFT_199235 [Xylariaceae sp. FL1272]|nr:hypothetical protein GGR57DRAFT_199235 [Xylariaceae sp. FL1272]
MDGHGQPGDGNSSVILSAQARPYRSKRHRPCDVCRRRKQACCMDGEAPCRLCRELRTSCTFDEPPSKRRKGSPLLPASAANPSASAYVVPDETSDAQHNVDSHAFAVAGSNAESDDDDNEDEGQDAIHNESLDTPWTTLQPGVATQAPNTNVGIYTAYDNVSGNSLLDVDGGDLEPQFAALGQHDMWYLASLWDSRNSGTDFHAMQETNGLVGEVDTEANGYRNRNQYVRMIHQQQSTSPANLGRPRPNHEHHSRHSPPSRDLTGPGDAQSESADALDVDDQNHSTQYMGHSSDMDPQLLEHALFSTKGACDFGHFQYRRMSTRNTVPMADESSSSRSQVEHFITSQSSHHAPEDRTSSSEATTLPALEEMVSPEIGCRLISLFLRYIFPGLPVLSRSRLQIRTKALTPSPAIVSAIPSYLLAAIYASVYPLRRYDPVLCLSQISAPSHVSALWRIAYEGIQRSVRHASQLAVLQAILIYLQRPPEAVTATPDMPGDWPMVGSAVHLAYQLGLHLDCRGWPIPPWERRLRRRLWWVVYSESAFRGLLLGLPPGISPDNWEVRSLEESDYIIDNLRCPKESTTTYEPEQQEACHYCHLGYDFRFLASLSTIAADLYSELYSVGARRRIRSVGGAQEIGRRLLTRLDNWKKGLPAHMLNLSKGGSSTRDYLHPGSATQVKLAYLTVEVLICRAMLQKSPLGPNLRGDDVVHDVFRRAVEIVCRASTFARRLGPYDGNSLFNSWSRNCFATISNFVLLLLVQAPTAEMAKVTLAALLRWVIVLREQCILFEQMQLGLLRLDAVFQVGMEKALRFPAHVKSAFQSGLTHEAINGDTR